MLSKILKYLVEMFNWFNLSNPLHQLIYDIGCGLFIAFMVAAKIFTFAVLIFQGLNAQTLRETAIDAASLGVIVVSIIMMAFSKYPHVIVVPDMFVAPFLIQMNRDLEDSISDAGQLKATTLAMILTLTLASGVLHVAMSAFRLLRFAEFLPYCVFCGMFSTCGLFFVQRSILFAPGYQALASMLVGVSLSMKIFWQKEFRPALSFVAVVTISIAVFYSTAGCLGLTLQQLREYGWLIAVPTSTIAEGGYQIIPWLMWTKNTAQINSHLICWDVMYSKCSTSGAILLFLMVLRRSLQLANLNKLFSCRAKTNREMSIFGWSQILCISLGTFGGVLSGPDMVRVKRMHGRNYDNVSDTF